MPYSGDVDAYGPAAFRFLPDLLVAKMGLGPHEVNGYVLRCVRTQEQLLVDAADDPLFIAAISSSRGIDTIVTTHAHPSHTGALRDMVESTHAVVAAHGAEESALPVAVTCRLQDGDTVQVGAVALTVVHLPGHTPGSVGLLHEPSDGSAPHLFSGDALLRGGAGWTRTVEERHLLTESLRRKVFDVLPDDTWVYPGHGPDTTVGRERTRALHPVPA